MQNKFDINRKKSLYLSSIDLKTYLKLKQYLKLNRISQNFFVSNAIKEKLDKDIKNAK